MRGHRTWILPLVIIASLIGLAAAAILILQALQPPRTFRIAAGASDDIHFAESQEIRDTLAKKGYTVEVVETEGALDNIRLLREHKADVAIVKGGVEAFTDTTGLATIAMLGYEPLWLIYNRAQFSERFASAGVLDLPELRDKRIGIGLPGSGVHLISTEVLNYVDIDAGDATLIEEGVTRTADKLLNGELDAAFFVTTANSPTIRKLTGDPRLGIVSTPEQEAVSRIFPFLTPITLHRGVLDLKKRVPAEDFPMMATRYSAVVRSDINADLVRLMLSSLPSTSQFRTPSLVGERFEFPNLANPQIQPHPDAVHFFKEGQTPFDRVLPFEVASPLSRFYLLLLPLFVLAVPVWTLSKATYRWVMSSQVNRWYPPINVIERNLRTYDVAQIDEHIAFLLSLERDISHQVKVTRGYLSSHFDLLYHVHFVTEQLRERRAVLLAQQPDVTSSVQ
jgi:TRAP-type uncharacterized transport system substrate-binding protein